MIEHVGEAHGELRILRGERVRRILHMVRHIAAAAVRIDQLRLHALRVKFLARGIFRLFRLLRELQLHRRTERHQIAAVVFEVNHTVFIYDRRAERVLRVPAARCKEDVRRVFSVLHRQIRGLRLPGRVLQNAEHTGTVVVKEIDIDLAGLFFIRRRQHAGGLRIAARCDLVCDRVRRQIDHRQVVPGEWRKLI